MRGLNNFMVTVYILNLFNKQENFYKIGYTSSDIKKVIKEIPYSSKIVYSIKVDNEGSAFLLKQEIFKRFKEKYIPNQFFSGCNDSFKVEKGVLINQMVSKFVSSRFKINSKTKYVTLRG